MDGGSSSESSDKLVELVERIPSKDEREQQIQASPIETEELA
jgi:hypothetical protein